MGNDVVRVVRSIKIAVTRRNVFDYVADRRNVLAFMDNLRKFEAIGEKDYGLGARFYWETALRGLRLGWEFVVTEFVPHERMAATSFSAPRSTSAWQFKTVEGGTLATFAVGVELPKALPVWAGRLLVERQIASNVERSLRNLRLKLDRPAGLPESR